MDSLIRRWGRADKLAFARMGRGLYNNEYLVGT